MAKERGDFSGWCKEEAKGKRRARAANQRKSLNKMLAAFKHRRRY
jgi:hypothetical protein